MLEWDITRIDINEGFCDLELKETFSFSRWQEEEIKTELAAINKQLKELIEKYKI
jgi:hypothetical protein